MRWRHSLLAVLLVLIVLLASQAACAAAREKTMRVDINGTTLAVTLEDNPTACAFAALLPLKLEMEDLHGNEKYQNLQVPLPANPEAVGRVSIGDVMLFGDNCLVIFYKSFATPYRYTRIGRMRDAVPLERVCGGGRVAVVFSNP